jgi:RNA polymerase sigma-70 factor (ECF subfamily)
MFKIHKKSDLSEEEIIHKAQKDISYFEYFYDKYYLNVFWFIYNRVENEVIASEISSDVFLKAMEHLNRYSYKGLPFINWLLVISRNEVNMYYRKEKKERKYFVHTDRIIEVKEEIEVEEKTTIPYEKLIHLLEMLPESEYELFHLKYFDKKSFKEISEITKTKEVSLRVKYHRIKKSIKELILSDEVLKAAAIFASFWVLLF